MNQPSPRPLISIAIPLHASRRWTDVVAANVARIPFADAEILVSDRTCVDDGAAVLAERLRGDARVQMVATRSQWGWVTHYNDLLARARGDFFIWMAQDDDFPSEYLQRLVEILRGSPEVWLAFGATEDIDVDGRTLGRREAPITGHAAGLRARLLGGYALAARESLGLPFRGVFRRQAVVDAGLFLETHPWDPVADALWVLAVQIRGGTMYVPSVSMRKRHYPGSTRRTWRAVSSARRHAVRGKVAHTHTVPRAAGLLAAAPFWLLAAEAAIFDPCGRMGAGVRSFSRSFRGLALNAICRKR